MKLTASLFLTLLLLTGCGTMRLSIPLQPTQQYVLGHLPHKAFTANISHNQVPPLTVIIAKDKDNTAAGFLLAPHSDTTVNIPAGYRLILKNNTTTKMKVFVNTKGEKQLARGYITG